MTTTTLNGYIARETDKAVAYVADASSIKALWVPLSKIVANVERDVKSVSVTLSGEKIERQAIPVILTVDTAFLEKVGAA